MPVVQLTATSSGGAQAVEAHVNVTADDITYHVVFPGEPLSKDFFFAHLRQVASGIWQIVAISAHRADLHGIGIGPAVLLDAKARLGARVMSSPAGTAASGVFRSASATAMWERMLARGNARYDSATDQYEVV